MHLVSIDPGRSSGYSWWICDDDGASRIEAWQTLGGYRGLSSWLDEHLEYFQSVHATFIAEKWIPYPTPGHSATLDSTYPLVLEGVLIDRGIMPDEFPHPNWRRSSEMYIYGGTNLADRKKRARAWLKGHDLLLTGKDVGCRDADDAVSSTLHALAWLRKHHEPSRAHWWGGDGNAVD